MRRIVTLIKTGRSKGPRKIQLGVEEAKLCFRCPPDHTMQITVEDDHVAVRNIPRKRMTHHQYWDGGTAQ